MLPLPLLQCHRTQLLLIFERHALFDDPTVNQCRDLINDYLEEKETDLNPFTFKQAEFTREVLDNAEKKLEQYADQQFKDGLIKAFKQVKVCFI